MKKFLKDFFLIVVSLFFFVIYSNNSLSAAEYFYESGTVSREYEKVKVYSFNYDYITKFTAASNYHNGEKVVDGGANLENVNFYSASRITINYDHYNNIIPWVTDNDSFQIFKYNAARENFLTLYRSFDNSKGEYTLDGEVDKEGLYKFAYVLDNTVKYVDYVYLYKNFRKMKIDFGDRYTNVSPALKLTFDLEMEDPYSLNKNKYYYAFGSDVTDNLQFKEITNLFSSAEIGMPNYNNFSKEVTVDIDKNIVGNKRLFVKCVRSFDDYEEIVYSKSINIINKVQGSVIVVDKNGNTLNGNQFYKVGETIQFVVKVNIPIQYKDLEYVFVGNSNVYALANSTKETTSFTFNHVVTKDDQNEISLLLRVKGKSSFYAIYNGVEIPVDLSYDFKAIKDEKAPEIVLNKTEENKKISSKQNIKFTVNEKYLSKVYYYIKACDNVVKDVCADLFDDTKAIKIEDAYNENGEYIISKIIGATDEEKFNEVALAIFVKAVDKANNETVEIFYNPNEYVVDNVIYEDGVNPIVYNDIANGSSFSIANEESLKIKKVSYFIKNVSQDDEEIKECTLEETMFKCASFSGFPFNFDIIVYIEDEYGNGEVYLANLNYYPVKDDVSIDGYTFTQVDFSKKGYEFTTDAYNTTYDETKKIYFSELLLNKLGELLDLNSMGITEKNISFVLNVGDEKIVLNDNVTGSLSFPTLLEIYAKLVNKEEYAKCAISGNNCDIETFIVYTYKIMGKYDQTRKIRVLMKDNTNKYIVEGFIDTIKVGVNESFVDYDFGYVNSLNSVIQNENITESVKILFNGVSVERIDTSKVGIYTITRTFVSSGVGSYPLSYTVNVVDEIAPTIKLKTDKDYVMKAGSKLEDIENWVTAIDNYDTNLKIKYSIEPELDVNTPGSYVVSIWAVDSSGNESTRVTRTIVVKSRGLSKSTYFVLAGIIVVAVAIITTFIIIEKKKQKKLS